MKGACLCVFALLLVLFHRAAFESEWLTPADMLLQHDPWASRAPPGFQPGNPSLADQASQFLPWAMIARERGALPLWNERAAAGQPLLANLQSAFCSPFALFHLLLPLGAALLVIACAKVLLAGAFTALLARRLGASASAATLAAVAYAFGGYQFLWLGHPHASAAAMLPLLLYLTERAREPRRWWLGPAFALGVAGLLTAGHIETALHVALAVAAYALVRLSWSTLGALVGWSLVGLALASVQLAPFVEYLLQSSAFAKRAGFAETWRRIPVEQWRGWMLLATAVGLAWCCGRRLLAEDSRRRWGLGLAVVASGLLAFVVANALGLSPNVQLLLRPDAWGHPVPANDMPYAGPRSYVNVNGGYAGVLTLGLALFAAVCGPRRHPGIRVFGWMWVAAFVMAYEVPLLAPLGNRLPLLSLSLNTRLMMLVSFSGAMLAAFGLDALAGGERRRDPRAFWRPALAIVLVLSLAHVFSLNDAQKLWLGGSPPVAEAALTPPTEPISGLAGAVEAVTRPIKRGERLQVKGWTAGADSILIELTQREKRLERTLAGSSLDEDFDLATFDPGPVRLRVSLRSSDGKTALIEERDVRWLPGYPVALRWWLLLLATLLFHVRAGSRLIRPAAVALVALDMFLFADGFNPSTPAERVYPPSPITDYLREHAQGSRVWAVGDDILTPNTAGVYGLSDVRSYDAMEIDRFEQFLELLRPPATRARRPGEDLDPAHPLFGLLDVGHVIAPRDWTPPEGSALRTVLEDGRVKLLVNEAPRARALVVTSAVSIDDYLVGGQRRDAVNVGLAVAQRYRDGRDWRRQIVIEGDAPRMQETADIPDGPAGTLTEVMRTPERLEYACESAAPAWLFVGDSWFPGWKAVVNGVETPIAPAFLAFRAVPLPAGRSTVVMSYEPASLRWGMLASGVGLLGLVLLVWRGKRVVP